MGARRPPKDADSPMDGLIKGGGLSITAISTIKQVAPNMDPAKREALLRRFHNLLNKYMQLAEVSLDHALLKPQYAGRSFLSSMGNNLLQILVAYTTLDEVKQQHIQATLSPEQMREMHQTLEILQKDKAALSEVRESLMLQLTELKKSQEDKAEAIEGEVVE